MVQVVFPLALSVLLAAAATGVACTPTRSTGAGGAPAAGTSGAPPVVVASPSPAAGEPSQVVRVGYLPILNHAPLYLAAEKGYYAEAGVPVQLVPLGGGVDMLVQTASGQFDIGAGGVGAALFNAVQRGVPVRVVAPLHTESPPLATPLVVAEAAYARGIRAPADLRGHRVGIDAPGAAAEYWLDQALRRAGLTIAEVELVPLPFAQMPAAMEGGALTAAILPEPLITLAERRGLARRLADDFIVQGQPTAVYLNAGFAAERADAAERFLAAYLRACRDLQGAGWRDPANLAVLARVTDVPAEVIEAASPPGFDPDGRLNVVEWERMQRFFLARGQLAYTDPLPLERFLDTRLVEAARRRLGGER